MPRALLKAIAKPFHRKAILLLGRVCLLGALACAAGCGSASSPVIHSLSPQRVPAGTSNFFLNVSGSGFTPGAVVLVDGAVRTTAFVNENQLSVFILASDVAQPRKRMLQVSVLTPVPAKTNLVPLLVQSATQFNSSPSALEITTDALPAGAVGVNYSAALAATNGVPPYSWGVIGGRLPPGVTLQASTGEIAGSPSEAGTFLFSVEVEDSSNQTASANLSANISAASTPVISGIAPTSGPSSGGTTVVIRGSNFSPGATVSFGGSAASSVNVLNAAQMQVVTPSHIAGTVGVIVQAGGQSSLSNANFSYNAVSPVVTSVSPSSGPTAGGTPVTINGSNFLAGALVLFGTVPAPNVAVLGPSQIQATTPPGASGIVSVTVENPGNLTGALASGFTYTAPSSQSPSSPAQPSAPVAGSVNWNTTYQQIDGFGGAVKADSGSLLTSGAANTLFGTGAGQVGFTFLRLAGCEDTGCTPENVAAARNAVAVLPSLKVITSWWTAPAAWKSNGSVNDGGSLLSSHYQDYANLISTYIADLASAGIDVYAVSPQNEPDITQSYDSMVWTDTQLDAFIESNLGPTLSGSGVKIFTSESSCWDLLGTYADSTEADSTANGYVFAYAAHQYDQAFDAQNIPSGKHLWMTEYTDYVTSTGLNLGMDSGLEVATLIHNTLTQANASAWIYWLIMGNGTGPQSTNQCLICNGANSKRLFTIGNFSKFVRPGYYRIDATANPVSGVYLSAYKDPASGNFAIVVINTNGSDTPFSFGFNGFTASSVTPWVSSASLDLAQQAAITAGSEFSTTLPAQSVTTFVGTNGH